MKKTKSIALAGVIVVAVLSLSFVGSSSAKEKDIDVKGYVTRVLSPTSFEIDDYRATVDGQGRIELENIDDKAVKSDPAQFLKVGTLVKIKGRLNTETLALTVKQIKIDSRQFRTFSKTTILDAAPTDVKKVEDGSWSGTIVADARRISIGPSTIIRFKLNKSEERAAKEEAKAEEKREKEQRKTDENSDVRKAELEKLKDEKKAADDELSNKSEDEDGFEEEDDVRELMIGSKPLQSLDQVTPGIYMTYKGKENLGGTVLAEQVVFVKNEKTKQEREMWKDLRMKEKEAKKANAFSKLKVGDTEYKVLPEKEVQEYVNKLGMDLIPEFQRQLVDEAENKIPFRFVVIHKKGFNAAAYPTGAVVIHHEVFDYLENEAQLAFLLSHEIAHATQEHALRQANKDKGKRTGLMIGRIFAVAMGYGLLADALTLTEAAMVSGYRRNQENQADRIGMAYMLASGYDPREAPRTWKVTSLQDGDSPTNFFWDSHASKAERRSFLMLTLRNTYSDIDFTTLTKDSDEFHQVAEMVRTKYPRKKKSKGAL